MRRDFNNAIKTLVSEYRETVTENEELKSLLMGALKILNHDVLAVNHKTDEQIKTITAKAERLISD